jgi:acylphosphatase
MPIERFEGAKVNGEIYGIPSAVGPSSCQLQQVCVRQDLMDAVGMETIASADDLYNFAVKVKEQFPEMKGPADYIFKPLTRAFQTEQLTWCSGNEIAVYGEESKKVYNYYETEAFEKVARFNQKMYDEGIYGDELTTNTGERDSRMQQGRYIWIEGSFGKHNEIIGATQQNAPDAKLMTYLPQPDAPKYIWTVGGEGLFVPYSAKNPEGAMMFLNWLYGSAENHQFAVYGVEGKHYNLVDGRVEYIVAPDSFFYEWMFRCQDYTLHPVDKSQEEIDAYKTWDNGAKTSDVLGFVFNNENVVEIETAVREVVMNDLSVITTGFVNFDENYPAAMEKMKAAGVDAYIAEITTQFEAHMANK